MSRNHAPDAEALRSAPRVLMVGEAPPAAGLGPLGAFDCASGWGLARLDPHHGDLVDADSHRPGAADAKRAMVESTLGLPQDPVQLERGPWQEDQQGGDLAVRRAGFASAGGVKIDRRGHLDRWPRRAYLEST